jgi:hypothetical protein
MTLLDPAGTPGLRRGGGQVAGSWDLIAGVLLSVAVVMLVAVHFFADDPHGDLFDGLVAVSMTLPVVWARRYPIPAAAVAALGAVVNWLFIGSLIRCGAAVPAAFWLACVIGRRLHGWPAVAGMALVLVNLQAQCLSDVELSTASIIALGPAAIAFWFAGRTIGSRAEAIGALAVQNAQLVATRERTARLAVDSDRERIAEGLDERLQQRISDMASTAAAGREQLADPESARAAFAAIAQDGRETLAQMRDVVDALRADAPLEPSPDLGRLPDLVTRCGGRLEIDGDPRPLPGGVELSGYRVVEQLLRTLAQAPGHPIDVCVRFAADHLELRVGGPMRSPDGPEVVVARQRLAMHGGSLTGDRLAGRLQWVARMPLTAAHG